MNTTTDSKLPEIEKKPSEIAETAVVSSDRKLPAIGIIPEVFNLKIFRGKVKYTTAWICST
jgi:hypothetical protein